MKRPPTARPQAEPAPPPPAPPAPPRRLVWLLLAAAVLLAGGSAGAWWWWHRPPAAARPEPPLPTGVTDPEVRAAIEQARQQVLDRPDSPAAWGHYGMTLRAHE